MSKPIEVPVHMKSWQGKVHYTVQHDNSYSLWVSLHVLHVETHNYLFSGEPDTSLTRARIEDFDKSFQREVFIAMQSKV